jgi:hypothetical protein
VVDQTWIMEEGERDDRMFIVAAGKASHRASPSTQTVIQNRTSEYEVQIICLFCR